MMDARKKIAIPGAHRKKLKWGVSGCGSFVEFSFLPQLQLLKRNKLVSVYSSDAERAKYIANRFSALHSFNNFDEFLKSDIDAVYIAGKNSDHYSQVLKAAAAGKHILCEKPIALNSEQAQEMVDVCEENKVRFAVDYVIRFHPLVLKAKELVTNQMIGKVVAITINYNIDLPPNDNFRFKKELSGGGALRDIGTHIIDLLRYFGGEVVNIRGFIDNVVYKSEVDDFAAAVVKFEKGGYGQFNVSYNAKKAFNRIEIVGYKGTISIENFIGKRNVSSKLIIDLLGEGKKAFRRRANKLSHMIKSVQHSFMRNEQPFVTGHDGLVNLRIMEELENQQK